MSAIFGGRRRRSPSYYQRQAYRRDMARWAARKPKVYADPNRVLLLVAGVALVALAAGAAIVLGFLSLVWP